MSYQADVVHQNLTFRVAPTLDPLSLQFVIWAQAADGHALDIGCGEGLATRALLARGGHVVAVDPDATVLHRLVEHVPGEQCRRLKVRLGQLPDIDFKLAQFAAIHAARVLHLLDPVSLQPSLRKFYRWLYPEGKLFVSVLTPKGARHVLEMEPHAPAWPPIHPLDEGALQDYLSAVGFVIEDSMTYLPSPSEAYECCGVIARCPG